MRTNPFLYKGNRGCGCDICEEAPETAKCFISEDEGNTLVLGEDNLLYVPEVLPEGEENQVIQYDEEGNAVADFITIYNYGDVREDDDTAGAYIAYNLLDAEGNVTGADAISIRQAPIANSIPERTATGQIRAQDPIAPTDLVNLRYLQNNLPEDTYVDGLEFDEETRELTLTQTGEHEPLVVEIPSTQFPEGSHYQVVQYDENDEPVAGYLDINSLSEGMSEFLPELPPASTVGWGTVIVGDQRINIPLLVTPRPVSDEDSAGAQQIVQRLLIGTNRTPVILTETTPDGVASGENDDLMVVNKQYLRTKLGGFFREEVNSGGQVEVPLDAVGSTTGTPTFISVTNPSDSLEMTGILRFTTLLNGHRRIGDGRYLLSNELSFDGGSTWVQLADLNMSRTGSGSLDTNEYLLDNRASASVVIPAGETIIFGHRPTINVEVAYGTGSTASMGNELEIIAGTEYPQ